MGAIARTHTAIIAKDQDCRISFQWGEDDDPCIDLAASRLGDLPPPPKPDPSKRPDFSDIDDWPSSAGAKAARLLAIEDPDFSVPPALDRSSNAKVTWLGHASVLVQLRSIGSPSSGPVRCLFDPMFSIRCSPSQLAGPIRSYPPPCKVEDLPPIDAVFVSHNHYDHMDYDSIVSVWRHSQDTVRFFVPLGNKQWLLDWEIPADRITEMDWWDSAGLTHPTNTPASSTSIKVWCTPAQHNSWRSGADADSTLWSSWCLEHLAPDQPPYRVFFAGDTGYQFHADPSWPPKPSSRQSQKDEAHHARQEEERFPACPAFAQVRDRIGPQHLLLLPVSVGATFAYLRSFVPLPDWINPFPRHSPGVTGANHMPPWDAVRVLKVMTEGGPNDNGKKEGGGKKERATPAVAVAMHWGTFVTDPVEVLRALGQLDWACREHGVRFARSLDTSGLVGKGDSRRGERVTEPWFVALNHGQSVSV
ncbi:N-acyl-phosphatidylethanolamine-hydrolyzing phospholipase D [Madurella mycetomatis]|uniref:N-acyl-phosphatidylethanolamine-hydrolyzing phospholipase D n=1 Tax=Madurella mycetomatis TaxID=100816 RepID=A0A175WCX9_9PEZI|nr:N-acyl-phosphatidylethanolamine-hydrolyzing phospholipase D [Madurella mycetomatis]